MNLNSIFKLLHLVWFQFRNFSMVVIDCCLRPWINKAQNICDLDSKYAIDFLEWHVVIQARKHHICTGFRNPIYSGTMEIKGNCWLSVRLLYTQFVLQHFDYAEYFRYWIVVAGSTMVKIRYQTSLRCLALKNWKYHNLCGLME